MPTQDGQLESGTHSLYARRNLWLLALGQGVSRLGDGLYITALAWTVWSTTQSAQSVALVSLAAYVPALAGSLVGAAFADRSDRRKVVLGCDLARGFLVALLAWWLASKRLDVVGLALLVALISLVGSPVAPARNALVPQAVDADQLLSANSLLQVSFRSAFFIGPLLLAPLLMVLSLPGVFAVNAATFVGSVATLVALRIDPLPCSPRRPSFWADIAAGWNVLRRAPDVQLVLATFVLALLLASGFLSVGLVALTSTQLHGGAAQYGLLLGIAGVAEVAGALLLMRFPLPLHRAAFLALLAWGVLGIFRLPLGFATALPLAAALLVLTGMASAVTEIPLVVLIQVRIPDLHLTKVFGLWDVGTTGAVALSPLLAGTVLAHTSLQVGFLISGIGMVALSTSSLLVLARLQARSSGSVAKNLKLSKLKGTRTALARKRCRTRAFSLRKCFLRRHYPLHFLSSIFFATLPEYHPREEARRCAASECEESSHGVSLPWNLEPKR